MKWRIPGILVSLGIVLLSPDARVATEETEDIVFEVRVPNDGTRVGRDVSVEGIARLPQGHHLWVFARRERFTSRDFWWIQNEGEIDAESGEWKVLVNIGEKRDRRAWFEIAVAVFEEDSHIKLQYLQRETMETNQPIQMPEMAAGAKFLRVRKVSHD